MLKKGFVWLLILVLAMGALGGCGPKETEPAVTEEKAEPMVLTFNLGDDVKTLDPQMNSVLNAGTVIVNTYEGLMKLDKNDKAIPGIAEKVDISSDGLTYKFSLRDAKWSDGQPVKASDFEYAWKRGLDAKTGSEYAFQLYYIKNGKKFYDGEASVDEVGVKALDDKTLEVVLDAPTSYFLELTAFFTYMPVRKDMVEKSPETWAMDPDTNIGNGPFKIAEYNIGEGIVLVKNENYYNQEGVKLDKINMIMINDTSTALTAYEAGEVDLLDDIPNQEIERLKKESNELQTLPYLANYYYMFRLDKKPMDDIRVRRALSLAIDRKAMVENILKGGQQPATGFVPPGLADANGDDFKKMAGDYGIDPNGANIEEAKKLLAEAGYPDGKGFPEIELLYNTSESHKAIAEAVQEMWKQNLNINIKLQNQEWAVFQTTLGEGNFTVAKANWFGDYGDPMTFLDLWTSYAGKNNTGWKNLEYDKLIEGAKQITGQERFKMLYDAEKMLMDDVVTMPIYYYTDLNLVKGYVKDVKKSILGYFYFDQTYIEGK